MSFIEVNEVSKSFRISKRSAGIPGMLANLVVPKFEHKVAVKDISFSIEEGEMVEFELCETERGLQARNVSKTVKS